MLANGLNTGIAVLDEYSSAKPPPLRSSSLWDGVWRSPPVSRVACNAG